MARIDKLFRALKERGGSDLHVLAGQPPKLRIHGRLEAVDMSSFSNHECEELLYEMLSPLQLERFKENKDLDFAYEVPGLARFRCNLNRHQHGIGAVFRIIPTRIKSLDELSVPSILSRFAHMRNGLVLVTGPTGSGKSTTLAAIIDYIDTNQARHVITIEDPIEFVHENKMSVITQREVGSDSKTFGAALKGAAREDPNVILVGEMRDLETIALAITCAEMGQIVFGTLHTNNAAKTIDRIIDVFPEEQQAQIRTMLATSLQGVVSQLLLRTVDGNGRVAVNEIMFGSPALGNMVRKGEVYKIHGYIESGRGQGMQLMDDSIMARLKANQITPNEAYMKAIDKKRFQSLVGKVR